MPELIEFNVKAKRKPIPVAAQQAVVGGIKIEHGKRYVTKCGEVTGPMNNTSAQCYNPEAGHKGLWYWTPQGKYGGMEHNNDFCMHIVAEYVEPVPFLPLQIGVKYKCQNGETVQIYKEHETNPEYVVGDTDGAPIRYDRATGRRSAFRDSAVHRWHIVGPVEQKKKYMSGQPLTAEEADGLYKTVQLEYWTPIRNLWRKFPKYNGVPPTTYLATWKWRIA